MASATLAIALSGGGCSSTTTATPPPEPPATSSPPPASAGTAPSVSEPSADQPSVTTARIPSVRGVLEPVEKMPFTPFRLVDVSKVYFDRMTLTILEDVSLTSPTGQPISPSDLEAGMTVDVWLAGGCDDTLPVRCALAAIRVVAP